MGQLQDSSGVLQETLLRLHNALLQGVEFRGKFLAAALARLPFQFGLFRGIGSARTVPQQASPFALWGVQLRHGYGCIAELGLDRQVRLCLFDAHGQGLYLLLEVVHLLLRKNLKAFAVRERRLGQQVDLDRIFQIDERRALRATRI